MGIAYNISRNKSTETLAIKQGLSASIVALCEDQFIDMLAEAWDQNGSEALRELAERDPAAYVRLMAEVIKLEG